MSFRNRLGLFFILIVIVPMMAVAVLLFGLLGKNERSTGQADIQARQRAAQQLFVVEQREAAAPLAALGSDKALGAALRKDDLASASKRAAQLLASRRLARVVLVRDGKAVIDVGDRSAVAPAVRVLKLDTGPKELGQIGVSVIDAATFASEVRSVTGLDVVVRNGGRLLASTLPASQTPTLTQARKGSIELGGQRNRVTALPGVSGLPGQKVSVVTIGRPATKSAAIRDGRIVIGAILLGFLVLAMACAVLVSRSLQQQLSGFLEAARRLASGDFSAQVTTAGRDEFAELGEEFNKMSRELERRLAELSQERERVQDSMRRLGEAVASKLDRDALLEIVVRTAVDGVAADAGRAHVRGLDGVSLQQRAIAGNMNGLEAAVQRVEADALRTGAPHETSGEHAYAMAQPLLGADGLGTPVGVVSVGRGDRPFTHSERELFHYLAGQAARSMESVDRHETVTRESMTDDLTGLANRRAFDDALDDAVKVARRSGSLGLVMIDLDDFKSVNDTYGHPQGDLVLREVARALRESSREIDLAARYGGEELALVLPGTDLEGAFNLAERVRHRVESLNIPLLNGSGALHVTASCGVAAVPQTRADAPALVTAADGALYEAKRTGKNKSVRAR